MRSDTISMTGIITGRIEVSPELSTSVCNNWDDHYPEEKFRPTRLFQLCKVDSKQNRHIKSIHLEECKHLGNLVKQFKLIVPFLNVESVWLIRKENEGDGFQEWHRDMVNNATSAYTIVVNLGAVEVKAVISKEPDKEESDMVEEGDPVTSWSPPSELGSKQDRWRCRK